MDQRIPRGYGVNVPPYQEIQEGIRPEASTIPMTAWTGLPPVRIDDHHNDPIVIDAGTVVGFATGGQAVGTLVPAHAQTGATSLTLHFASEDSDWGLRSTDLSITASGYSGGPVKPVGVVFQPIYSFMLQQTFRNYKRNENVGFVTDYVIQIPVVNALMAGIQAGDLVMVNQTADEYGRKGDITDLNDLMGTVQAFNNTAAGMQHVIGKCLRNFVFAAGSNSTTLSADYANVSLTSAGKAEFKGLERVQTVPGLGISGSGTKGVPAWLTKAVSDGSGDYRALQILVRI